MTGRNLLERYGALSENPAVHICLTDPAKHDPGQEIGARSAGAAGLLVGVKERREWFGRVRGANGRQRWIRAVDPRPASRSQP